MIFGTNSNYMLKYQKAKAKLVEYDISQKDYPKFPLNSNELSYPVIYILSRYAESIIENDETGKAEFAPYMVKASQYFDASVGANDRTAYDTDFLLSGAAAYFLSNDFGSSKVLCATLFEKIKDTPTMGTLNCTPFVRQYGILFRKWGVFVCQRRKNKRHMTENSKSKPLKQCEMKI